MATASARAVKQSAASRPAARRKTTLEMPPPSKGAKVERSASARTVAKVKSAPNLKPVAKAKKVAKAKAAPNTVAKAKPATKAKAKAKPKKK